MQQKRHSLMEACLSTLIGFVVAFISNLVILPYFGFHPSLSDDFIMTIFFTFVSVVRGYWVRRLFNHLHVKGIL